MNGKIQEFGLTEIIPFICISAIWSQYPGFSQPDLPWGRSQITDHRYSSPSWVPLGLTGSYWRAAVRWWLWYPCLWTGQERLHFSETSRRNLFMGCHLHLGVRGNWRMPLLSVYWRAEGEKGKLGVTNLFLSNRILRMCGTCFCILSWKTSGK